MGRRYPFCAHVYFGNPKRCARVRRIDDMLSADRGCRMPVLPRDVRKALELLEGDSGRQYSVSELAAACGVAPRTLQKHFRGFLGRTLSEVRFDARLKRARRELLRGQPDASVTDIALSSGVSHFGRFAAIYRVRYHESPSATLRRCRPLISGEGGSSARTPVLRDRPVVGVLPFLFRGTAVPAASAISDEIATALRRDRSIAVGEPKRSRYQLRGKVEADHAGRLSVVAMLMDTSTGRYIYADRWDGEAADLFTLVARVATGTAASVERFVRKAEIDRACRKERDDSSAWELTMRAFPRAVAINAAAQGEALELLEQAIELVPTDALPIAMAAWCHGHRGGHHFTTRPAAEKEAAHELAARAAALNTTDPTALALLASAYTLAHDLPNAAIYFQRALALDGACVWAWNRSGWVNVYRGEPAEAIDRFQIARSIAPDDSLKFFCSIGIAAAHFEAGRYEASARWFTRGLIEHPSAIWANRFRAAAYALAGQKDQARRCLLELTRACPDLTISDVRVALPHTPSFMDRASEGLEAAGMGL
jgi:AraC-like DNA-binding protein/tetratricopeptide (TPR) repeat protein